MDLRVLLQSGLHGGGTDDGLFVDMTLDLNTSQRKQLLLISTVVGIMMGLGVAVIACSPTPTRTRISIILIIGATLPLLAPPMGK